MTASAAHHDALLFLPLGGTGEIGMNLNLYGHAGKWLMVDLGTTFADETLPGVDLIVPDPSFIESERENLVGLVLTHAHEDHLGAVPYLWPRLRCPVYASRFAAAVLRRKLADVALENEVPIIEYAPGETLRLGPFAVTPISITHSIPESQALAIETSAGTVLHSGDWKLDPGPLVGPNTDADTLMRHGEAGVLALVCDSTNVFRHGESGSESAVRDSLRELLANRPGRIVVTTFASNIARIETVAKVAEALDRHLVLVGRSLWKFAEAARESGYLHDMPPPLSERDYGYLPRDKVLLLCTGCQGETRGAMARIASGQHSHVTLQGGDVAVFSSKIIPGNERTLYRLHNLLALAGVEVITEKDHFVHVSGHPARDELAQMYQWIRPRIAVPVHGEPRHLVEHARLARALQVPEAVVLANGDLLQLAPGPAKVLDRVPAGRLAVDGQTLIPIEGEVLQRRRKLMYNGAALAVLVLDALGNLIEPPRVSLHGVAQGESDELARVAVANVAEAVRRLPPRFRADDERVTEAARRAVRQAVRQVADRKPVTDVQIVRLSDGDVRRIEKEEAFV
ncbi:MAG TPA: ribonuclease J [Candidatus Cybelea sp.]|nr:ribonuclease J [Candidatus Cybelea sp.]